MAGSHKRRRQCESVAVEPEFVEISQLEFNIENFVKRQKDLIKAFCLLILKIFKNFSICMLFADKQHKLKVYS